MWNEIKPGGNDTGYSKKPYGSGSFNKKKFVPFRLKEEDILEPLDIYRSYAVISNLNTPPAILDIAAPIARKLDSLGYTVRVGGSLGFEELFEQAAEHKELHLPWRDFNQKESRLTLNTEEAYRTAKRYYPVFDSLKLPIKTFLARNVRVMMGKDLKSPVMFLICWTDDGVESILDKTHRTGFVALSISIAHALKIPVFNLQNPDALKRLEHYIGSSIPT